MMLSAITSVAIAITLLSGNSIDSSDPLCKTPELSQQTTQELILQTQTMDLNFVELARRESGLYNRALGSNTYYGIFQIHPKYHKLNDYCNPVEQVIWLEYKLENGADPKKLFPGLWESLYVE